MSDVFLSASQVKRCFSTSGGDFWALKGVDVENLPLEEIIRQSLKKMVKA